jgi:hypothetical protein
LVSNIRAEDGKIANLFFTVYNPSLLQAANMLGNGFAMLVGPAVVKYNNTVEEAITGKQTSSYSDLKVHKNENFIGFDCEFVLFHC